MSARTWTFAACLAAVAGALGCGSSSNSINPVPVAGADASADASIPETSVPDQNVPDQQEAGVVRTVSVRDPFGMLEPGNTVYDGDFEFTAINTMQPAWSGLMGTSIRTGAVCRSGLRCVELDRDDQNKRTIIGWFVWPNAPYAEFSFYMKIGGTDCETEAGGVFMDMYNWQKRTRIYPTDPNPVDGWCHYGLTVPVDPDRNWYQLALSARRIDEAGTSTGPVIVDEVSLRGTATPPTQNLRANEPLPQDMVEAIADARSRLGKLLPPNPPREPKPVRNPTGRRLRAAH